MYSAESLRLYNILIGAKPITRSSLLLRSYFAYKGDYNKYETVKPLLDNHIEIGCVVHGVYHHKDFAYWCKNNILGKHKDIDAAISAKMIMSNDLSYIHEDIYCIWYPTLALEDTYKSLYTYKPHLRQQIAHACCVAHYNDLYKQINHIPEINILKEAYDVANNFVINDIHVKASVNNIIYDAEISDIGLVCEPSPCEYNPLPLFYSVTVSEMREIYTSVHKILDDKPISDDDILCMLEDVDPLKTGNVCISKLQNKIDAIARLLYKS